MPAWLTEYWRDVKLLETELYTTGHQLLLLQPPKYVSCLNNIPIFGNTKIHWVILVKTFAVTIKLKFLIRSQNWKGHKTANKHCTFSKNGFKVTLNSYSLEPCNSKNIQQTQEVKEATIQPTVRCSMEIYMCNNLTILPDFFLQGAATFEYSSSAEDTCCREETFLSFCDWTSTSKDSGSSQSWET